MILVIVIVLAAATGYVMFFAMPEPENVIESMEKDDFVLTIDLDSDDTLESILLAEHMDRSLTFFRNINGDVDGVVVIYFDSREAAKLYVEDLEEPEEDEAVYIRANTVIFGDKDAVDSLRWKVWIL